MRRMPVRASPTAPVVSQSSDALNINRRFFSHIALCDEQPRSISTFWLEPRSSYSGRTRSGVTCLSWTPAMISAGIFVAAAIAVFQPHVVVDGARRTPVPHVAPTGSDAIRSDQTASRTDGSN